MKIGIAQTEGSVDGVDVPRQKWLKQTGGRMSDARMLFKVVLEPLGGTKCHRVALVSLSDFGCRLSYVRRYPRVLHSL